MMMSLVTTWLTLVLATPEPIAPTAVHLDLEDPANAAAVRVTCRRGAAQCARTRTFEKTHRRDAIAWAVLAPLVDELASSPLMDASEAGERGSPLRWQLRIGGRHNRRATQTGEHRWGFEVVRRVLDADSPLRPGHALAMIEVERYVQRDPASEVRRVTYRCDADALWCRSEETHGGAIRVRWLEWQRLDRALATDDGASLLRANAFTLDADPRLRRWRWSIQLGDRTNSPGLAAELPADALRLIDGLLDP